jgi:hypothetical protein
MNKKIVIVCTLLALLLLGGIGFGFYKLFAPSDLEGNPQVSQRSDAICAVPSDAVLVYDFATYEDMHTLICSEESQLVSFLDKESPLNKFVNILGDEPGNHGAVISIHYPSKNTIAPLFVLSVKDESERAALKEHLSDNCAGVINKKYSGVTIGKAVIPAISYAFCGNYLLASPAHVLVESSVRHLENSASIQDNPLYARASKSVNGRVVLHVNHQNIGKFFSGAVNTDYLGKATFFSSFASWSAFSVELKKGCIYGDGVLFNLKGEGNFSNVLSQQRSRSSDIYDILPHNTEYVFSMVVEDAGSYLDSYQTYLESVKKINDYLYLNSIAAKQKGYSVSPKTWFMDLDVQEIAVAALPDGKGGEKVLLMKMDDPSKMELCTDYVSTLLGGFFAPDYQQEYAIIGDWVAVGSEKMVETLSLQIQSNLYFSMKGYLEQSPASSIIKEDGVFTGVVNMAKCSDSLSGYFKEKYSGSMVAGLKEYNFNYLVFRLGGDGGTLVPSYVWYADNLAVLPQPPVADVMSQTRAVYDETVVEVPKGPFAVKNFVNGKTNYLQQTEDNKIKLLNENKSGVWTIPFDTKICGYVTQVDHYKNNKLQMLFCAGSRLYMLDRLGRWVKSYPVDLHKEVLLGPEVYDFEKNLNYTLMVLHTDNTLAMYDIKGNKIESWTPLTLGERVKQMPQLLECGGKRYWIVRTGYQTVICNENGLPVADFTRKKRLLSDTKVELKSDNEVMVTTIDGRSMVLNLQTGSMKKN